MTRTLRSVFSELVRLEIEIWTAVDARLREDFDLPLTRYEPMQVIYNHHLCRVYDIAEELVITHSGASKLVDRIEASGYCRRLPNPADRRSSMIELTVAGSRLVLDAAAAVEDELHRLWGPSFSAQSLRQFHHTLSSLRRATADPEVSDELA